VKVQRRLSRGLQALGSYTWAHALDYGSTNASLPYRRGNSDFDLRHNFSQALSYDLPGARNNRIVCGLLNNWGIDERFSGRTGFPVTLNGRAFFDTSSGQRYYGGLNTVPGEPVYVYSSQYPGGRSVNVNAFSPPTTGQLGDSPRNFVRGFSAWQMDLAVRKTFRIAERLTVQFRAEAFNLFNHPTFGTVNPNWGQTTFGQSTATLSQSLGVLSPLYQMGGPRSLQFALKLAF
jgi:hypothetical protein